MIQWDLWEECSICSLLGNLIIWYNILIDLSKKQYMIIFIDAKKKILWQTQYPLVIEKYPNIGIGYFTDIGCYSEHNGRLTKNV